MRRISCAIDDTDLRGYVSRCLSMVTGNHDHGNACISATCDRFFHTVASRVLEPDNAMKREILVKLARDHVD